MIEDFKREQKWKDLCNPQMSFWKVVLSLIETILKREFRFRKLYLIRARQTHINIHSAGFSAKFTIDSRNGQAT